MIIEVSLPDLAPRSFLRIRSIGAGDGARIDAFAAARQGLEVHRLAVDLHEHERVVGVETKGRHSGLLYVAGAQLGGAAGGEVMDALLRLQPFVEMFMALEDDAHAMFLEDRLQLLAQIDFRPVPATG